MTESRHIVVEGPIGVGKAELAAKLADKLSARLVQEDQDANPFLAEFMKDRQKHAFQTQLFFLLSRFKQMQELSQLNLFHKGTVSDCLFERDRIFAMLNLGEEEFALYDQVFNLMVDRVPAPDLVIYLSARTESLWQRIKTRKTDPGWLSLQYLSGLNEAYNHFFFHYSRAPLLVVNTNDVNLAEDEAGLKHLAREVENHKRGVKHYVPLGAGSTESFIIR